MSDWKETKESQEGDQPKESTDKDLAPVGRSSIRGEGSKLPDTPQEQPKDDENLATLHAGRRTEYEPPVETEPRTIQLDPEDQSEDPEGSESREGERGSLEAPENCNPRGIEG
jgi:hypothetical protein